MFTTSSDTLDLGLVYVNGLSCVGSIWVETDEPVEISLDSTLGCSFQLENENNPGDCVTNSVGAASLGLVDYCEPFNYVNYINSCMVQSRTRVYVVFQLEEGVVDGWLYLRSKDCERKVHVKGEAHSPQLEVTEDTYLEATQNNAHDVNIPVKNTGKIKVFFTVTSELPVINKKSKYALDPEELAVITVRVGYESTGRHVASLYINELTGVTKQVTVTTLITKEALIETQNLDFGNCYEGMWTQMPLKITNLTDSNLDLRLNSDADVFFSLQDVPEIQDRNFLEIDEFTLSREEVIEVYYQPPSTDSLKLTEQKFNVYILNENEIVKIVQCTARSCASIVECEGLDFGECDVGSLSSKYLVVKNLSNIEANLQLKVQSKVLTCPSTVTIAPNAEANVKVEIYPRKVNMNYHKQIQIINQNNRQNTFYVDVLSQNRDKNGISYHSLYYSLNSYLLEYGLIALNQSAIKLFSVKSKKNKLRLLLTCSSPQEMQIYKLKKGSVRLRRDRNELLDFGDDPVYLDLAGNPTNVKRVEDEIVDVKQFLSELELPIKDVERYFLMYRQLDSLEEFLVPISELQLGEEEEMLVLKFTPTIKTRMYVDEKGKKVDLKIFIKILGLEHDETLAMSELITGPSSPVDSSVADPFMPHSAPEPASLPVRELLIRAYLSKSTVEISQRNINFGLTQLKKPLKKSIIVYNRSKVPLLFHTRKSGSISSHDLYFPRLGLIPGYSKYELEFTFSPTLSGVIQERIGIENVHSTEDISLYVKAHVRKQSNFFINTLQLEIRCGETSPLVISNTVSSKRVIHIEFPQSPLIRPVSVIDLSEDQLELLEQKISIAKRKGRTDKIKKLMQKINSQEINLEGTVLVLEIEQGKSKSLQLKAHDELEGEGEIIVTERNEHKKVLFKVTSLLS